MARFIMLTDHILFIDAEALVIDKPAGLPVDPPRDGALSLDNHLASLAFGFQRWPVAVHRLDRDTSGCLLLARNPKAAGRFTRAFEDRLVTKTYLAIVDGLVADDAGEIGAALVKTSTAQSGWRMRLAEPRARGAKDALTRWQRLAVGDGRSLLRFTPATGRTHQLRVHAADALGHAITGDPVYGGSRAARRTLLHAETLVVPRTGTKRPVAAHAPMPADFAALGFAQPALHADYCADEEPA